MSFGDTLIEEDGFGFVPRPPGIISEKSREIVRRYTLTNKHKAIVRLISWGASIQSIKVPNRDGKLADVVLGFDDMDGYLKNRYMGSIIGRVANCVSGGSMHLDNVIYPLSINDGAAKDCFNGGTVAFDNANWQSQIVNNRVVMSHLSRSHSQGYPGDVLTQIKYTWTDDNQLHINIRATSTSSTPVNITNYCLFNLAGHNNLPTSIACPVDGTLYELRLPVQLNQRRLFDVPGGGYNHNLCVNSPSCWCYRFHARILHPASGRFLEVYSNHPGLQVYTGNMLPHQRVYPPDLEDHEWGGCENVHINSLKSEIAKGKKTEVYGKGGVSYRRHGGFALSPRNYSNTVNVGHFPSCMLYPGKIYMHDITYKFGVLSED
ncbi:Aldose 1-epimerase [Temnothorax longispinosus]|uniref:Galactose mutarotase n=1 Tax=Temnothorax longispinosus TaxID=300112 RepID=A0A4S2KIK4_9HYME|nr:Aldose 1-epimerase [Temnothorax longispinosus]